MILDTHGLAWAAGFFDGEGSTYLDPNPRLCVVQNDLAVLLRFLSVVPGGRISGGKKIYGKAKKPMWQARYSGWRAVQVALALLWKHLSLQKRQQALRVFKDFRLRQGADPKLGSNRSPDAPICGVSHGPGGVAACQDCSRHYWREFKRRARRRVTP